MYFAPKVLGSSARIVCHGCWRAVLDLSICWVCGECIARGDEVVSLGWCFWHRACFGCLMCGSQMSIPDKYGADHGSSTASGNAEAEEDGITSNNEITREVGVELEEIPLCRVCKIETAGDMEDEVLQRGLDTVTTFDGGLTRDRLNMLSSEKHYRSNQDLRRSNIAAQKLRLATRIEDDLKKYINDSSHESDSLHVSLHKTHIQRTDKGSVANQQMIMDQAYVSRLPTLIHLKMAH
jgi:hypothetical protein